MQFIYKNWSLIYSLCSTCCSVVFFHDVFIIVVVLYFYCFSLLFSANMKLRLRHKERTMPIEINNETTLKMLKLQAQNCYNVMLVSAPRSPL